MSTNNSKMLRLAVAEIGLPIVFGLMIELACDLLKYVVRYFSTSIYFDVQHGMWRQVKDTNTWIGLAFAIVLVILSTWVLDNWKWAHPRRGIRTGLLLISVIFAAMVDPFGHIFKDDLLRAFQEAQVGEPMSVVLKRFTYDGPSLVWPHKNDGDSGDCIGDCWIRLTYDVPAVFGERWVSLEFDRDQKLLKKIP